MLDDELAALNSGNAKAIAAFFTPTAVLDDRVEPLVTTGNDQIGRVVAGYVNDMGMQIEAVGPVFQYGRTVARFAQAPGTTNQSSGFMLAMNGRRRGAPTKPLVRASCTCFRDRVPP